MHFCAQEAAMIVAALSSIGTAWVWIKHRFGKLRKRAAP